MLCMVSFEVGAMSGLYLFDELQSRLDLKLSYGTLEAFATWGDFWIIAYRAWDCTFGPEDSISGPIAAISGSSVVICRPLPGVDLQGRLCIYLLHRGTC